MPEVWGIRELEVSLGRLLKAAQTLGGTSVSIDVYTR
jgi:hypothetical protein